MNAIVLTAAISAIFDDANESATSFLERLMAQGLGDRAAARPYALRWASQKYGVKIKIGQRGECLPKDSAADEAVKRVLTACYGPAKAPASSGKGEPTKTRVSAAERAAFKALVQACGGDEKRLAVVVKALRA
tara:strand:- start:5689 stop:6087 length:399 start_codon:yes stop_codon:yes gene_type:complete